MISDDIDIEDCIETVLQSLPVCKVRGVAYSTFSIVHMKNDGEGYLFEFDNPQAVYIHDGECIDLVREELNILGKTVYKSNIKLSEDDFIVIMSDGAVYAGVGSTLNFGWQREDIKAFLAERVNKNMSAKCVAGLLASACNDLYLDRPGDDTTVLAVKARKR